MLNSYSRVNWKKAFDEIKGINEDSEFHRENEKAQVEGQKAEINKWKKKFKQLKTEKDGLEADKKDLEIKLNAAKEFIMLKNSYNT